MKTKDIASKKDNFIKWEKLEILSRLFASILIPLIVTIVGGNISNSIKESEVRLKYIQVSLEILKEPPKPETENLRKWAIETLNQFSEVPIDDEAKEDLEKESIAIIRAGVIEVGNSEEVRIKCTDGRYRVLPPGRRVSISQVCSPATKQLDQPPQ